MERQHASIYFKARHEAIASTINIHHAETFRDVHTAPRSHRTLRRDRSVVPRRKAAAAATEQRCAMQVNVACAERGEEIKANE